MCACVRDNGRGRQDLLDPLIQGAPGVLTALAGATTVLLLADFELARLPLEALGVLAGVPSIVRDFSLHMHVRRRRAAAPPPAAGGDAAAAAAAPIVAAMDGTAYVVDTRKEDTRAPAGGPGAPPPRATHIDALVALRSDVGKGWRGVTGDDRIAAPEEWARLLAGVDGAGSVYFGPGRLLACVATAAAAGARARRSHVAWPQVLAAHGARGRRCTALPLCHNRGPVL